VKTLPEMVRETIPYLTNIQNSATHPRCSVAVMLVYACVHACGARMRTCMCQHMYNLVSVHVQVVTGGLPDILPLPLP
jgi:hypothetical protein